MTDVLYKVLKDKFGYDTFRPGQLEIIQAILSGQDVFGVLPTGSGKSLCYQLPTYLQSGLTVIVSPLISLMQDQVVQLHLNGEKRAIALNSTLSMSAQKFILTHLETYHFLFISPETLGRPDVLNTLQKLGVGLFVIDEAHCISQWGVDFRPSYLRLNQIRKQLKPRSTLILTATATPKVQADILQKLALTRVKSVIYSVDRPNIFLDVLQCENEQQKQEKVLDILRHIKMPGILYFGSRQAAEEMADRIQETLHLTTAFYHGELNTKDRYLIQQDFMRGSLQVVCATNAFGMGINKKNVRFVIHYHAPTSFESYLQEIGRAGRDGQQSIAILCALPNEIQRQQRLLDLGLPTPSLVKTFFKQPTQFKNQMDPELDLLNRYYENGFDESQISMMLQQKQLEKRQNLWAFHQFIEATTCRRQQLLTYFGEQKVVVHDEHCCRLGSDEDILRTLKQQGLYRNETGVNQKKAQLKPKELTWQEVLRHLFK